MIREETAVTEILAAVQEVLPDLARFGWRLLAVVAILLIGFRAAGSVQKMASRTFVRMDMEISLRKFLQSMIYAGICVLTVFIAADKLGVSSASIVAILGSAGLALSLSLQNVLSNFAGGVIILLMKPFKVGDYIVCGTEEGTVTSIGLVYTTLGTIDNRQVVLPNGALSNMTLTNATAQEKRRLEIKVGIGYGSDLKKAKEILLEQFRSHPCVRRDEELLAYVDALGESSVVVGVRGWVSTGDYMTAKWELTEQIKLAFDEAGIEIPFRQMDVHVKPES